MLLIIAGKQHPTRKGWEGLEGSGDPGRVVWLAADQEGSHLPDVQEFLRKDQNGTVEKSVQPPYTSNKAAGCLQDPKGTPGMMAYPVFSESQLHKEIKARFSFINFSVHRTQLSHVKTRVLSKYSQTA